jgi:hypothetical protein
MAKVFPIGILPVALKSHGRWRWRLAAVAVFPIFVGYCAAPFLATGGRWLRCSLESSLRRPPWETLWAVLDGRYEFGYVGPLPKDQTDAFFKRYDVPMGVRATLLGVPPEVYGPEPVRRTVFFQVASRFARNLSFLDAKSETGWLYLGVTCLVAIVYGVTFVLLPAEMAPRRRLVFAAFSMFLFFFWSKGWSPQFVAYLLPLLLIVFPAGESALWCLLLAGTAFLEMPVWAVYVHGRVGMAALDHAVLQVAIVARTAIFLVVLARLYPRMFRDPD